MKTEVICCVCGKHLRWIDTSSGGTSHGYCKKHFEEAMREAERFFQHQVEARVGAEADTPPAGDAL